MVVVWACDDGLIVIHELINGVCWLGNKEASHRSYATEAPSIISHVDDALDVLEEEHEEDLQIVGGRKTGTAGEGSSEVLGLVQHQMWFFFWILTTLILAFYIGFRYGNESALSAVLAAPVALVAAAEMVRYVTNFFLEYDEDDEDAPSLGGFALKGIGLGLVWALIVLLVAAGASGVLTNLEQFQVIPYISSLSSISFVPVGFISAAITIVISFASAPAYLAVLRKRDEAGDDTSGLVLNLIALAVATLIYAGAAIVLVMIW